MRHGRLKKLGYALQDLASNLGKRRKTGGLMFMTGDDLLTAFRHRDGCFSDGGAMVADVNLIRTSLKIEATRLHDDRNMPQFRF